jgi:ribokinase
VKENQKVPKILAIGKATQDVFLMAGDVFSPHVEANGIFAELPLGAKLDLENVVFATGGNATNASVTFARQGLHAQYMWALGAEPASQAVLIDLDTEGVDTGGVVQDEQFRASYSCVMLAPTGERTILNFHGTMLPADGHPLDLGRIKDCDWLYISSLGSMELLERIVTMAAKHGVKVMFNPAGSELKQASKLKSLLSDIEVLILNKEEMQLLVEGKSPEELVRHGLHYCPVVIVSDGPNGVCASDGKQLVKAGMYEDVPVIDRLGAGDAFGSGFLSQWSQGKSLQDSIVFASANSTSVVGSIGAKAGILHKGTRLHDMPLEVKALQTYTS